MENIGDIVEELAFAQPEKEFKSEFVPVPIPDGMHAFGLVNIKSTEKRKFQSEEMEPAFRFVFQAKDIDGGFINILTGQSLHSKGVLHKLLVSMTGNKIPTISKTSKTGPYKMIEQAVALEHMKGLMGKWFYIQVVNQPGYKDPTKTYANAANKLAMPHPESDKWGDCKEFFKANPGKFSKKEELNAANATLDFSNYPDHESIKDTYKFNYDITHMSDAKREDARKLIALAVAKQMDAGKCKWRTCNEVPQLAKYRVVDIAEDDIPF